MAIRAATTKSELLAAGELVAELPPGDSAYWQLVRLYRARHDALVVRPPARQP